MSEDLKKMKVTIEGDAKSLKKELGSARGDVRKTTDIFKNEIEKMRNSFRKLSNNGAAEAVRNTMQKIKASVSAFSLKDKTKEFQIRAGIKVPTEEYEQVKATIEKAQAQLGKYYERRSKMEDLGVGKESMSWKNLAYDIEGAERKLRMYEADRKRMEADGTDVQRPASIKSVIGGAAVKGFGGAIKGIGSGVKSLASGVIQKSSGAFSALIQKFSSGIPTLKRARSSFNGLGTSGKGLAGILKTVGIETGRGDYLYHKWYELLK